MDNTWTTAPAAEQGAELSADERSRRRRYHQLEKIGNKGLLAHALLIVVGLGVCALALGPKSTASFMIGGGFAVMNLAVINWIILQIAAHGVEKMGTYMLVFFGKFLVLAAVLAFVLLKYKPHGGPFIMGYSTLIPVIFGITIARGRTK